MIGLAGDLYGAHVRPIPREAIRLIRTIRRQMLPWGEFFSYI